MKHSTRRTKPADEPAKSLSRLLVAFFLYVVTPLPLYAETPPTTNTFENYRGPLTISIIPPVDRQKPEYPGIADAIVAMTGNKLADSPWAAVVSRDQLARFYDEKLLAKGGLSDRADLAGNQHMISADVQMLSYYSVNNGDLRIAADLIPTKTPDGYYLWNHWGKTYKHLVIHGPVSQLDKVLQRLASQVTEATRLTRPIQMDLHADPLKSTLNAKKQTLAIFTPTAAGGQTQQAIANVFSTPLQTALAKKLNCEFVSREHLDALLDEHKLALAGLTNRQRQFMLGTFSGASMILVGSVIPAASGVRISLQLLSVANGGLLAHASIHTDHPLAQASLDQIANNLAHRLPRGTALTQWLVANRPHNTSEAASLADRAANRYFNSSSRKISPRVEYLMQLAEAMYPHNRRVLFNIAYVDADAGKIQLAKKYYEKLFQWDIQNANRNCAYGQFLNEKLNEPAKALPYLRKAVKLAEENKKKFGEELAYDETILARDLVKLNHENEAIAELRKAIGQKSNWGYAWEAPKLLAELLEKKHQWEQAGDMRAQQASQLNDDCPCNWRAAYHDYVKAGNQPRAMAMLERTCRFASDPSAADELEIAEHLKDKNPDRAATFAYQVESFHPDQPAVVEKAKQLLLDLHQPQQPAPFTGSVFNLAAMRKKGCKLALAAFDGFDRPQFMQYAKNQLEDIYGIPVVIVKTRLSPRSQTYARSIDTIELSDNPYEPLQKLRRKIGAQLLITITDSDLLNDGDSTRANRFHHVAIISAHFCPWWPKDTPADDQRAAVAYSELFPAIAQTVSGGLEDAPGRDLSTGPCPLQTCLDRKFRWNERSQTMSLCPDCLHTLRQAHPEDTPGPQHRPNLVVGPRNAVLHHATRPVVLAAVGFDAKSTQVKNAARAIRMSTGLPIIIDSAPVPDASLREEPQAPGQRGFYNKDPFINIGAIIDQRHPEARAVCLITNVCLETSPPRWLPWLLELPHEKYAPENLSKPLIIVSTFGGMQSQSGLPRYLKMDRTVIPAKGKPPFKSPVWAKLMVAGLAFVARGEKPCWQYGCPTTLWENMNSPLRVSYWLGDQCRAKLQAWAQN